MGAAGSLGHFGNAPFPKACSQGSCAGSTPAIPPRWVAVLRNSWISSTSSDGSPRDASAERLGPDDRDGVQNRRKPAIELDEEQAIIVGQLDAAAYFALQCNHLLPEREILGRKLAL